MTISAHLRPVTPAAVKSMLADGGELALIDVREELIFSQNHLLWARSVPMSRLELRFARLVPRRSTRIVLCDDSDGMAERAAEILARAGYSDLSMLQGGVAAWAKAGFMLFSGMNVPSKAFGEFVEHDSGTPSISADELNDLMRSGTDMVVLDSRPFEEYARMSDSDRDQCAGRRAGVARARRRAIARNHHRGQLRRPHPQHHRRAVADQCRRAQKSGRVAQRHDGLESRRPCLRQRQSRSRAEALRREPRLGSIGSRGCRAQIRNRTHRSRHTRTLARRRDAHAIRLRRARPGGIRGRPPSRRAVGARRPAGASHRRLRRDARARIVLTDDKEVRAVMTASWLRQMGWQEVYVLPQAGDETGTPAAALLGRVPSDAAITCAKLREIADVTIVDLSTSPNYRRGHIPGAWFAIRSRLARALEKIAVRGDLVLTSEDGMLAGLAVADARALVKNPVHWLEGGNAAWVAAGFSLSTEGKMADETLDVLLKPYERSGDTQAAMNAYLLWEVDLPERIKQDGTTHFLHRR